MPGNFLNGLTSLENNPTQKAIFGAKDLKKGNFFVTSRSHWKTCECCSRYESNETGKFLPITGLEIISPDSFLRKYPEGSTVYVMNSNYFNEIKEMSLSRYNYIKLINKLFELLQFLALKRNVKTLPFTNWDVLCAKEIAVKILL